MEGDKGSDSDSDFASAENEGQEEIKISASNSPLITDDITTPTTSSEQNDGSRDDEKGAESVQVTEETVTVAADDEKLSQGHTSPVTEVVQTLESGSLNDTSSCTQSQVALNAQVAISTDTAPSDVITSSPASVTVSPPTTSTTSFATSSVTSSALSTPSVAASDKGQTENKQPSSGGGSWGWGSWGSVWSSVTNITESAGKGISSVISSVEGSLGIPSPTALVEKDEEEDKIVSKLAEDAVEHDVPAHDCHPEEGDSAPKGGEQMMREEPNPSSSPTFWDSLGSIASSVQSTSAGIVAGSLGALETIGKKTMDILSEGDPGLRKKRELLGGKPMTLSELVREAKAEAESRKDCQNDGGASWGPARITFSLLFDEYQGVVHLEALELLALECGNKFTSEQEALLDEQKEKLKEQLEKLRETFKPVEIEHEGKETGDGMKEVTVLLSGLSSFIKVDKLTKAVEVWRQQAVVEVGEDDPAAISIEALYERGMRSLAEITSVTVCLFRKIAEVSLLPNASDISLLTRVKDFNRVTILVTAELELLASLYSQQLMLLSKDDSDASVTSLYLEASNSSSYITDAFQLLLPVLEYNSLHNIVS